MKPSKSSVAIQLVPFDHDTLKTWRESEKSICISLHILCRVFRLEYRQQSNRLTQDPLFEGYYRRVLNYTTMPKGASREDEDIGLDIEMLPAWLMKLDINRIHESKRSKLLLYQRECARVLREHWNGRAEIDKFILPGYRPWMIEYDWEFASLVEGLYGRQLVAGATYPKSVIGFIGRVIRPAFSPEIRRAIREKNRRNARGNLPYRDPQIFSDAALEHVERKRHTEVLTILRDHSPCTISEFTEHLNKHDMAAIAAQGGMQYVYRIPHIDPQFKLPFEDEPTGT